MEITKEQKQLKVLSSISLIFGLVGVVLGAFMLIAGIAAISQAEKIITDAAVSAEDLGKFSGLFIGTGIIELIVGICSIINWSVLKKVAKDATKYKPAWTITLFVFCLGLVGIVLNTISGASLKDILHGAFNVGINAYILTLINKVKATVTQ